MPETQTITVMSKALPGENRKYGRTSDEKGKEYVVFNTTLLEHLTVGSFAEIQWHEVTRKDKSGTYISLDNVKVDGKWLLETKPETKPAAPPRSYGKSPDELIQQRQLAEAQNRSIQAQTALNRAVDLTISSLAKEGFEVNLDVIEEKARRFYQLLQSLTEISIAEVIQSETKRHTEVKQDKGLVTKQVLPGKEVREEPQEKPKEEINTAQQLAQWAYDTYGKTPTQVRAALGLKLGEHFPEDILSAVKTLKEKWETK